MEIADKFQGKSLIMLDEYFQNKIKLAELRLKQQFLRHDEEIKLSIEKIEKEIRTFISSLNVFQLRQLIYMNLDFDDLEV